MTLKKGHKHLWDFVVVTQLNLTQLKETKEPVFVKPALFSFCVIPADPPTDLFLYFFQPPPLSLLVGVCCTAEISSLNSCRPIFKSSNVNRFQMVAIKDSSEEKEAELQPKG